MKKKPIVVIAGPTAVGKTEISIQLAHRISGEIISADSMQVYHYMDIGSAKITKEEMDGVKHYLVDELDPKEEFHVVKFQEMAKEAMEEIYDNCDIPLIVGGTGFYVQALLRNIDFTEENSDETYRHELEKFASTYGNEALHDKLREIDKKSAEAIHVNNVKRVIRALEYYHLTGQPISEHNEVEQHKESPYNYCYFVLTDERENLYRRINKRIDLMLEAGLVTEVQNLKDMGCDRGMVSMQGLGYKEILAYLDGDITYDEAIYKLKRDTRHFAKRQLTWFRRENDVIWIEKNKFDYDDEKIINFMIEQMKDRGLI